MKNSSIMLGRSLDWAGEIESADCAVGLKVLLTGFQDFASAQDN